MIWNGTSGVNITTAIGETFTNVQYEQVITFNASKAAIGGYNDFEIYLTFPGGSKGTSVFHLSCSDDDMNDFDDCGKAQGNGKDTRRRTKSTKGTASSYVNDFLFGGMGGENGEFTCPDAVIMSSDLPTEPNMCTFVPPQEAASCYELKDVTELTMVWNGDDPVNVTTYFGETFNNVQKNESITFAANTSTPLGNNFEIYLDASGVSSKSVFHLSCSDNAMDGPDDCGMPQGGGKQRRRRTKSTKGTTAPALPLISDWLLGGMKGVNGEFGCPGTPASTAGADVRFGFKVITNSTEPLNIVITDDNLDISKPILLNDTYEFVHEAFVFPGADDTYSNTVDVTAVGSLNASLTCSASDSVEVKRIKPVIPVKCEEIKKITGLSLIWDGADAVDIEMSDTRVSPSRFENVMPGDTITFTFDQADTGNNLEMTIRVHDGEIDNVFGGTELGMSEFHVSCSDSEMNGTEDCGTRQGDGRDDDPALLNDWLLDGMAGENGSFICKPPV